MAARLAALGALEAEGTLHEDSPRLCCLCLIVRSQSLSVVKLFGPGNCVGGSLRWSAETKCEAGWVTHGCVHHARFGAAGVQELLSAKEIQG